ncbi:MAG: ATP-binding protein [Polyangiaceae bacterium]|nr:ATP-binding protein [Polyangiaceae bacterium]
MQELRTLLGKPTAFIGRDAEIQTLEDHFQQCTDDQVATAILVMAEAGMGKSRLLYEFLHSIRRTSADFDVWTVVVICWPRGRAFALLAHMLRGVLICRRRSHRGATTKDTRAGGPTCALDRRRTYFRNSLVNWSACHFLMR